MDMKKIIRLQWGETADEIGKEILEWLKEHGKAGKGQFGEQVEDNISLIIELAEE